MGLMSLLKRFLFMPKYRGASLSRITFGGILGVRIIWYSFATFSEVTTSFFISFQPLYGYDAALK